MKLDIDSRYSTFSLSIVLYLLHNNEDYNKLWISKYPTTEGQAKNFFKNENCGCRPALVFQYKKDRFPADLFTVNFINENKGSLDFDKFCKEKGGQELKGHVFAIPAEEHHYKDFLASLEQRRGIYDHFSTLKINDKILITFF